MDSLFHAQNDRVPGTFHPGSRGAPRPETQMFMPAPSSLVTASALASRGALRVLVVEDVALIAMDLEDLLADLGCLVVGTADTAAGAIREAGRLGVDVAFMDVDLNGPSDGVEAATEIRRAYGIPSVFVTARRDEAFARRAAVARPLGIVSKPFAPRTIRSAVEAARLDVASACRAAA